MIKVFFEVRVCGEWWPFMTCVCLGGPDVDMHRCMDVAPPLAAPSALCLEVIKAIGIFC